MGVSIHYRGRMADLSRIEDFEDRLVDFALEFGGLAEIWRTWADDDPSRVVRGVILNLAPGHESTSLLISPEGWLIGLTEIQDAEEGRLTEPPWCCTKTQFGPVEGHVALVEMFTALKSEFLPDLEVSDEGGYWETRDFAELVRRQSFLAGAIDALAKGLKQFGLSSEAAEDPEILARHVERVATLVHRNLRRPSEHPPVTFDDDDWGSAPDAEATEKQWDELYKHNRRQQERLQRAIEELRSRGLDHKTAFQEAMREIVPELPEDEPEPPEEPWRDDDDQASFESLEDDIVEHGTGFDDDSDDEPAARHPLLQKATDFFVRLDTLFPEEDPSSASNVRSLSHGAAEAVGGLAQALSCPDEDGLDYGLRLVQLKRALRGVAFARGAVYPLRSTLGKDVSEELFGTLKELATDIASEIGRIRSEYAGDESL
jgi:hypothetical protein